MQEHAFWMQLLADQRQAELRRRWDEEHERLIGYVRTLQQQAARSADMASRYRAAQTRLARFESVGPPPDRPREQNVRRFGLRRGALRLKHHFFSSL